MIWLITKTDKSFTPECWFSNRAKNGEGSFSICIWILDTEGEEHICMYFTKSVFNIPIAFPTQKIEIKIWQNYIGGWHSEEDKGTAETAWITNGSLEDMCLLELETVSPSFPLSW